MKSRLMFLFGLVLMFAFVASAQTTVYKYAFSKAFPDTGFKVANGAHGVAVDPDGKVWIVRYSDADSMLVGSTYKATIPIRVYNANGTPASFSPIRILTIKSVAETLYAGNNRGIARDKNGNIVVANNLANPTRTGNLYRINYKTGAGIDKVSPQVASQTQPAFDDLNEMFTANVSDGVGPIRIFDGSFSFLGNVVDTSRGFSRTLAVSKDGNDVYFGGFTNNKVTRYHSANGSLGPYSTIDTVMKGLTVECFGWHPKTGYLWAGGGNATSGANLAPFTDYSFYAFKSPNFNTPVDSIKWSSANLLTNDPRPRGIAFSNTGDTAYICAFNVSAEACVQMFVGKSQAAGVHREDGIVVSDYQLMQNYPNPFNPSTQIKFTVPSNVTVSLKVYDMLGKEVATLVEGEFSAGSYTADMNGKNLSSGMYFYTLKTSNGFTQTKKMMLLK